MKKRSGVNKLKSSVDNIMNIIKLTDEHSCYVHLLIFCAVNRTCVPTIAGDLSDMAVVRLELSQLRHQVEMLVSQISSVSYCKCYSPKQVKNTVDVHYPLNAQCDAKIIDDTIEAHS